ncbi:putative pectinesterase precursor [Aequoribacter fuscus]|uniref:Putative pectinesterase n=1 Tax=Aequoribacter fuscus TaxID=2518989 RepID=F3KZ97_9GAMM|nr:pectate lyase [Aequoribacter fuscus]EGG30584.1 putative pectinesterase precursor [Aequoribacter fuscus]QHJ87481.1 pectate lyase [Aequoribacter fuscus]
MSTLKLLSTVLVSLAVTATGLSQAEDKLWLDYAAAEGSVRTSVEGEMPDYSMEREWTKHHEQYPYIKLANPRRQTSATVISNITYGNVSKTQTLDLVLPESTAPTPMMLLIHGGAWRSGHRDHFLAIAKSLAEHGYAAATVSYRTSREALYPAGMRDLEQALSFLKTHASQYNLDPSFIGLIGGSSGAHMASLLGVRLNEVEPGIIDVVVNFDGIVETQSKQVRYHEDRPGKLSYLSLWLGGRTEQAPVLWREVSPLAHVSANTPPFAFINSSHPRFHAGRNELVDKLKSFGTPSLVHEIPDTPHTFWLFEPWLSEAMDTTIAFLNTLRTDEKKPLSNTDYLADDRLPMDSSDAWTHYKLQSSRLLDRDNKSLQRNADISSLRRARVNRYQSIKLLSDKEVQNLLSFQTPSGGWSKNTDFINQAKLETQHYGREPSYVPTFDNGATTSELRLLARLGNPRSNEEVRQAIEKGLKLILSAQMPNGGWPQSFPLRGGYHDLCTHNDNVTANILELLIDVSERPENYQIQDNLLNSVRISIDRAIEHIVSEQYWINDDLAAWGQQHDPITHELVSARSFEPAALATTETADLIVVLMRVPNPSLTLQNAINAAAKWLEKTKLTGKRWQRNSEGQSQLITDREAPDLWPRFIDPVSGEAIFGDRNGRRYSQVSQISTERQRHYGWYQTFPARALIEYQQWLENF